MLSEPVIVVAKPARAFDALGIRYRVGGSLASSVCGIPRATPDVDPSPRSRSPRLAPLLDVHDLLLRARREHSGAT